jgi:hypothetical protein
MFRAVVQGNLYDAIINIQHITHILRVIVCAGYIPCDIRVKASDGLGKIEKE